MWEYRINTMATRIRRYDVTLTHLPLVSSGCDSFCTSMFTGMAKKRKRTPKSVLKLPDLEQSKSAVLNSLLSISSQ
jgi:hypothetical protein